MLRVVRHVTEDLTAAVPGAAAWGIAVTDEDALAALYVRNFSSLVRLAALLLDDVAASEDVAQEAYVRVAQARSRLRDPDAALAYLRRTVVNLSRSALRRRLVARRHGYMQARPDSTADATSDIVERDAMVRAVRQLPRRMREAVSLRYYADLSEAETATVMGVSKGSVKSYTSRGLALVAAALEVQA
jgi:RNA polymerase sigma-70 factor (sigma-E family)